MKLEPQRVGVINNLPLTPDNVNDKLERMCAILHQEITRLRDQVRKLEHEVSDMQTKIRDLENQ